ncbi:MAG: hypothetical protein ACR2HY_01825 [Acidimicrobiales bacterium]
MSAEPVGPAGPDGRQGQCKATKENTGYDCPWGFEGTLPGSSGKGSTGPKTSPSAGNPGGKVAYFEEVSTGPDGKPCLVRRTLPVPADSQLASGTDFGATGSISNQYYPMCPAAPGDPKAADDPRPYAVQGWEEAKLPAPQPYIGPGWAITGKLAYLETKGQRRLTFTKDTPVGPLRIDAVGRYYVDWGDGEKTGPHSTEGGPWPDGEINHMYINVGRYNVVVTERWNAQWSIGASSGTLAGQQTVGRIDNFRVEQIQAVVGPG